MVETILQVVNALAVAAVGSTTFGLLRQVTRAKRAPDRSIQDRLVAAIDDLRQGAERTASLLAGLQKEIADRAGALHAIDDQVASLRRERELLTLTPDQQEAIAMLVRRPRSIKESLTSSEFWLNGVLPNAVFYVLGVLSTYVVGR